MLRRTLISGAVALLFCVVLAPHARAFGVNDVIQMHQDGISDDLILEKIQHSGKVFHLDAGDLRDLKKAGIPDSVITVMLRTEDRDDSDDNDSHYGVNVGVYGGWCGPVYGPIWWPRFVGTYGYGYGYGGHVYGRGGYGRGGYGYGHGGYGYGHGGYGRGGRHDATMPGGHGNTAPRGDSGHGNAGHGDGGHGGGGGQGGGHRR